MGVQIEPRHVLISFVLLLAFVVVAGADVPETCSRRCVAINCNNFGIRYGKYCGVGWSGCPGEQPCDELDACCKSHDDCVGEKSVMNVKCHEKFKRCINKVKKSGKRGFSKECSYEIAMPTMIQGMDMAILLGQMGSQHLEL